MHLLDIGITVGQMMTIDDLQGEDYRKALAERDERHWVYKLEGTPCKRCGANIVLEEFRQPQAVLVPGLPGLLPRPEVVTQPAGVGFFYA